MQNILIADDNKQITAILGEYANKDGFNPVYAFDGEEALKQFLEKKIDIILLDVMMPKLDGFSVCKEIRRQSNVPIIMVTAKSEDYEKIMGLDVGADDYVTKPFSPAEVMARVRAILRRVQPNNSADTETLVFDNLSIDINTYVAMVDKKEISLTKKEFEILWTLCNAPKRVFSREQLLDLVWGYDFYGDSRTVDSHIKRLRAKLEAFQHENWAIKTIWGKGYAFEVHYEK